MRNLIVGAASAAIFAGKPAPTLSAFVGAVLVAIFAAKAAAAEPPRAALKYRADLVRSARLVWGLDAPVAILAAQIHQESAWRPDARSPYAHGLAQFTPDTADWIGGIDPALQVTDTDTGNPIWALRALARYDHWLHTRVPHRSNACVQWAQTLRAYNGGLGWLRKEARSNQPCTAFRAAWACRENLAYPVHILIQHQPRYARWGGSLTCAADSF